MRQQTYRALIDVLRASIDNATVSQITARRHLSSAELKLGVASACLRESADQLAGQIAVLTGVIPATPGDCASVVPLRKLVGRNARQ